MEMNWKENVEERRAYEAVRSRSQTFSTKECVGCSGKADNYHAWVEHGLCEDCRDAAFEKARATEVCPRCGTAMYKGQRFFSCPTCGLVITVDPEDHIASVSQEHASSRIVI